MEDETYIKKTKKVGLWKGAHLDSVRVSEGKAKEEEGGGVDECHLLLPSPCAFLSQGSWPRRAIISVMA